VSFTPRAVRLLRIATIAIVAALLAVFLRNVEWDKLAHALRHASLVPLLLSSVLYFVCLFGKALSWRIMRTADNSSDVRSAESRSSSRYDHHRPHRHDAPAAEHHHRRRRPAQPRRT